MPKVEKPKRFKLEVGKVYRTRCGGRAAIISTTNKRYGDGLPIIAHHEGVGYAPPYTLGRSGMVYPEPEAPYPVAVAVAVEHPYDILDDTAISAVQFR